MSTDQLVLLLWGQLGHYTVHNLHVLSELNKVKQNEEDSHDRHLCRGLRDNHDTSVIARVDGEADVVGFH